MKHTYCYNTVFFCIVVYEIIHRTWYNLDCSSVGSQNSITKGGGLICQTQKYVVSTVFFR